MIRRLIICYDVKRSKSLAITVTLIDLLFQEMGHNIDAKKSILILDKKSNLVFIGDCSYRACKGKGNFNSVVLNCGGFRG